MLLISSYNKVCSFFSSFSYPYFFILLFIFLFICSSFYLFSIAFSTYCGILDYTKVLFCSLNAYMLTCYLIYTSTLPPIQVICIFTSLFFFDLLSWSWCDHKMVWIYMCTSICIYSHFLSMFAFFFWLVCNQFMVIFLIRRYPCYFVIFWVLKLCTTYNHAYTSMTTYIIFNHCYLFVHVITVCLRHV